MIIRAAGDKAETGMLQRFGQRFGVGDNLRGVGAELRPKRFTQGNGLGGHDVHERAALLPGKD